MGVNKDRRDSPAKDKGSSSSDFRILGGLSSSTKILGLGAFWLLFIFSFQIEIILGEVILFCSAVLRSKQSSCQVFKQRCFLSCLINAF